VAVGRPESAVGLHRGEELNPCVGKASHNRIPPGNSVFPVGRIGQSPDTDASGNSTTLILSNAREALQKRLRLSEGWRSAQASRTSVTPVEVFEAESTALSPLFVHSSSHAAKQQGWRWYLCNSCISPSTLNSASSSIRFRRSVSPHRAHASPHPGPPKMRSGLRVGSFPFWIASRAFSRRGRSSIQSICKVKNSVFAYSPHQVITRSRGLFKLTARPRRGIQKSREVTQRLAAVPPGSTIRNDEARRGTGFSARYGSGVSLGST